MNKFYVILVTYFKLPELKECTRSLYLARDLYDQLIVWDNCSDNDVVKHLVQLKKQYEDSGSKEKISLNLWGSNVGKAKAVNTLLMHRFEVTMMPDLDDDDIVCIADGDIIFQHPLILSNLKKIAETGVVGVPMHDMSSNHCHLFLRYSENTIETFYEGMKCYRNTGGRGVAGACMTMRVKLFRSLNGFDENSIYGGNEASLWRKYPSHIYIPLEYPIYHQFETNIGYQEYKILCQREIRAKGYTNKLGYFDQSSRREEMKHIQELFDQLHDKFPNMNVISEPDYDKLKKRVETALDANLVPIIIGTNPPDEVAQGLTKTTDVYCGRAWQVVADLRTRRDVTVQTLDMFYGVTIVQKSRNRDQVTLWSKGTDLLWPDFEKYKNRILNFVSYDSIFAKKKDRRAKIQLA